MVFNDVQCVLVLLWPTGYFLPILLSTSPSSHPHSIIRSLGTNQTSERTHEHLEQHSPTALVSRAVAATPIPEPPLGFSEANSEQKGS